MKKLLLIAGLLITLAPVARAQEFAERVTLTAVPSGLNVVLTRPVDNTRWLLKLKSCPTLKAGDVVTLGVNGELNGRNDYLDLGLSRRCEILQAFEFNEVLDIKSTNRNRADVKDETNTSYTIFNDEGCGDLTSYINQKVYVMRYGRTLDEGDKIFVPGTPRVCFIRVAEKVVDKDSVLTVTNHDAKVPTRVTHVRAFPRNGKVALYWRAAQDDVRVDHYVVSYSKHFIDPKHLTFESAPSPQTTVKGLQTTITNLENDTDYYFYVIAVDTAGNPSTFWSEAAHARVQSSIDFDPAKLPGPNTLMLEKGYESERLFFFQWKGAPTATRFLVTLEADGQIVFSHQEFRWRKLRVAKLPSRQGKDLKLTVSAFDDYSFLGQQTASFSF